MSVAEQVVRAREAMASACARRHRPLEAVRLLAAVKTVEPARIREAHAAGIRLFGDNRVQERESKREALADLPMEWHLLGPLQSNKAARALALFDCVETVDSLALAQRLSRLAAAAPAVTPLQVMLEVNVANEPQKHGIVPEEALDLATAVATLPGLALRGLMAVPPAVEQAENARRYFAAMAELSERVRSQLQTAPEVWDLSMGMSHDYVIAIEEGATIARLGTALFGAR